MISFGIEEETKFEPLIERLISYKKQGLIEGNWSVFSAHRLLAERDRKINLTKDVESYLSYEQAQQVLIHKYGYTIWRGKYNGVFACYLPSKEVADAIKAFIRKDLRPLVDTLEVIGVSREDIIAERDHGKGFSHIRTDVPILSRLKTFSGILQNGSIDIAYWKKAKLTEEKNLDEDNCGFIWVAVSSPNDEKILKRAKACINKTLFGYDIDPIFVVDGALAHETYLMASLIFDKADLNECHHYGLAFKELSRQLEAEGLVNYRLPVPIRSARS